MNCKKCGSAADGEDGLCDECKNAGGNALICEGCQSPITENVDSCLDCGAPSKKPVVCGKCGLEIPEGNTYCLSCGARADKKLECLGCGRLYGPDVFFCDECGYKLDNYLSKPIAAAVKKPKRLRGGTLNKNKIARLIKTWVATAVFLLAFCFSLFSFADTTAFINIGSVYTQKKLTIEVEFKGSPFKAIQAWAWFKKDFYAEEEEFERIIEETTKLATYSDGTIHIESDYNYLKLEAALAGQEKDSLKMTLMVLQGLLPILLMLACLAFFVFSLIQSIKATAKNRKTSDKLGIIGFAVIAGAAAAVFILCKITGSTSVIFFDSQSIGVNIAQNGIGVALLILSSVMAALFTVIHYVFTDIKIDKLRLISQAVSLALLALILSQTGGNIAHGNAGSLFYRHIYFDLSVTEFWQLFIKTSAVSTAASVLSGFSLFFLLVFLAAAITLLITGIKNLIKPKLFLNGFISIVMLASAAFVLIFTKQLCNLAKYNVIRIENLEIGGIYLDVGDDFLFAWPIMITALSAINLVFCFITAFIARAKETNKRIT